MLSGRCERFSRHGGVIVLVSSILRPGCAPEIAKRAALDSIVSPAPDRMLAQLRPTRSHRRGVQKYSPPQARTPNVPPAGYGQPPRNDMYTDAYRGVKRQRSESDLGDSTSIYPPSQIPRTSYTGYGSNLLSQSYGHVKPASQQLNYPDQSAVSYTPRESSYQPPLPSASGWPNVMQQAGPSALSTNTTLGNISEHGSSSGIGPASSLARPMSNYFGNTGSAPSNYGSYNGNYHSQPGGQYAQSSRTSSESYPSLLGLQTPTSMTDIAGLPSGHDSSYIPSSSGAMSATAGTAMHTPSHSQSHSQDYAGLSGSYGSAPRTYDDASSTYPGGSSQHQQTPQQGLGQLPYAPNVPGTSHSAGHMLLSEGMSQNFYNQEESAYPTPTQNKPPSSWV